MVRKAELAQSSLFAAPVAKPMTPLVFGNYDQMGLGMEAEQPRIITIENCLVQAAPVVVEGKKGIREWRCGFSAPADLWHQDRDELIEARASSKEIITLANSKRLKPGDMVTITGIVTQQQLLVTGVKVTQLTYLNVKDLQVGLRAAKNPMLVKTRR